jgi:hypothetical protein
VHRSGFPIALHTVPFRLARSNRDLGQLWERSVLADLGGVESRVLSPADALLHVCGHAAFAPSRGSLVWACDAWWIIQSAPDLRWDVLLDEARRRSLALPLGVMLRYLAGALQAPIPAALLAQLGTIPADTLDREAAVHGAAAAGLSAAARALRATPSWPARAQVLRWLVLPSPRVLREAGEPRDGQTLPIYYLARLSGVARRAVAGALRGRNTTTR